MSDPTPDPADAAPAPKAPPPPPARVVGAAQTILLDLKNWLEGALASPWVADLAAANSTVGVIVSVGQTVEHMLDPNSGREAEREADLSEAFQRGDLAYLEAWLADVPAHPQHSNDLARWYIARLKAAA